MIDEELLDGMNFGDLNRVLDYLLKRIDEIQDNLDEDEDDLRLDMLYVVANKIITRMDSIAREYGRSCPDFLVRWNEVMSGYEECFKKYEDSLLEDDTLLDLDEP